MYIIKKGTTIHIANGFGLYMQFYLCVDGQAVGHLTRAMALYRYTSPTRYAFT